MAASEWLKKNRFGLFIHWGLYSIGARHEWLQKLEHIHPDEYAKYAKYWEPDLYSPELWAQKASEAGMSFFCITAKHHDGFCLWDSKLTDFKATNTPYGKDAIAPMVKAFRNQGIQTGLYYSLIDWHHPDFVIDSVHPLSNHPDRDKMNKTRNQKKYIDYLHNQMRELLSAYNPVDLLFFDFSYPRKFAWPEGMEEDWHGKGREDWGSLELLKLCRELAPTAIINDRLDLEDTEGGWDFRTPEQYEPLKCFERNGKRVPWMAVYTFSGSWGYNRDEESWKSVEQLIQLIINITSKDGSLMLNVGPTGRGDWDCRNIERLTAIGEWMKYHKRSIVDCTAAPDDFVLPKNCVYTYNPELKRLYVHVYSWPNLHLHLPGLGRSVEYAQLLNDGSEIKMEPSDWYKDQMVGQKDKETLTLTLPIKKPNVPVPVIELFMKQ